MLSRHLAAFCFVVLTLGCGQGDGQVCQIDGDCQSGLVCACAGGAGSDRGVCRVSAICAIGGTDSGVGPEAGTDTDAAIDADVDTGVTDADVDSAIDADLDADLDAGTLDADLDADLDAGTLDADLDADALDAGSDAAVDANDQG